MSSQLFRCFSVMRFKCQCHVFPDTRRFMSGVEFNEEGWASKIRLSLADSQTSQPFAIRCEAYEDTPLSLPQKATACEIKIRNSETDTY